MGRMKWVAMASKSVSKVPESVMVKYQNVLHLMLGVRIAA